MLLSSTFLKLLALLLSFLTSSGNDKFNYGETDWNARDFGPADWGEVECSDVDTCVSAARNVLAGPIVFLSTSHTHSLLPSLAGLPIGKNWVLSFPTRTRRTCARTVPRRTKASVRSTRSHQFLCGKKTRLRVESAEIATSCDTLRESAS